MSAPALRLSTALTASLFGVALLVLVHRIAGGGPAGWAQVDAGTALAALPRTALLLGVYGLAMFGFALALDARRSRTLRGLCLLVGLIGLPACVLWLAPQPPLGDWAWMLHLAGGGAPLGKWYLASLLLQLLHAPFAALGLGDDATILRALSALAGAGTALLFTAIARDLGLAERWRAWPLLHLVAFGGVAMGLAHLEVYALVAFILTALVWCTVRVIALPSMGRVLAFSAVSGVAIASYIGFLVVIPGVLATLAHVATKLPKERRLGALAGLALLVAIPAAILLLGPAPYDLSLVDHWSAQSALSGGRATWQPAHLPADAFWELFPHLLNPRHWFAGWHGADLLSHASLDDPLGLALLLALGGWIFRTATPEGRRTLILVGLITLPWLALAFTVAPKKAYPWDWDLVASCASASSLLLAVALAHAPAPRWPRLAEAALVWIALGVWCGGIGFLRTHEVRPLDWGPPNASGLSLSIAPSPLERDEGDAVHLFAFVKNEGSETFRIRPWLYELHWRTASGHSLEERRPLVGPRELPAGTSALIIDELWTPPADWDGHESTLTLRFGNPRIEPVTELSSSPFVLRKEKLP